MQDKDFFSKMLGLTPPWHVKEVELEMETQRVTIVVEARSDAEWEEAGQRLTIHGYEERRWRHLDTMQFETIITARVPRLRKGDGSTAMAPVPWAQARSRWTLMYEAFAIRVIQMSRSISQARELLRLDWSSVERIMERAVQRGLDRRSVEAVRHVGMDEKSFGRRQSYISTLVDLDAQTPRVLEVEHGRDTEAGKALLKSLPEPVRKQVKAVAMDMSAAYQAAVRKEMPEAEVVHDRFHVSKLLGEAVDKVRRGEHVRLMAKGDKRLLGTRYIWLYNPSNLNLEGLKALNERFEVEHLQTARAYYHRIRFGDFWRQPDTVAGSQFFARWFHEAQQSCLEPVIKVSKTLQAHLTGLLSYFRHKITNSMCECFNSIIQAIKASAKGFRSFENYRTRILFFLGKLDLAPR